MNDYQKLTLKGKSILKRNKIYFTNDYLLLVNYNGFNEIYKRLYYKDIQAIHLRKTNTWVTHSVFYWLGFGFFALLSIFSFYWTENPTVVTYLIYLGIFVLPTIVCLYQGVITLVAGPSCQCTIHTAVQRLRISAVTAMKQGEDLISLIDEGSSVNQPQINKATIIEYIKNPPKVEPPPRPRVFKPAKGATGNPVLKPAKPTQKPANPPPLPEKPELPVDDYEDTIDPGSAVESPLRYDDDQEETIDPGSAVQSPLSMNQQQEDTINQSDIDPDETVDELDDIPIPDLKPRDSLEETDDRTIG